MSSDLQPTPPATPKWIVVLGWILSILPALMLIMSGTLKFMPASPEIEKNLRHIGWNPSVMMGLGILELTCVFVYLIPRTSVLGAILLTGYLGGAFATHVRVADPLFPPLLGPFIPGIFIWLGLVLRDARVRALLPLRKDPAPLSLLLSIPLALLAIVFALVVIVLMRPDEFHVERSLAMDAPREKIFAQVNDFHKWDDWSPWAKIDKNAKLSFEGPESGPGAVFKWAGNDEIGEGSMTILENVPNERIRIKLEFIKPYPGKSDTEFTFTKEGSKTVVTWSITGKNDLQGKVVCLLMNMDAMIGDKYDEGLKNLKKNVESK